MRSLAAVSACAAALFLTGCPNPNAIGVQKYGTIAATCVLASSGQPVANALVSVNSTQQCSTHADGTCPIVGVPIGSQTVTAFAPGLQSQPVQVQVLENQTVPVTLQLGPAP
jgi:hypothetical protein